MTPEAIIIEFEVEEDEAGGYVASAQVDNHSLATQGETLDELRMMVEDLLRSFTANSCQRVLTYSLVFQSVPAAT